MVVEVRVADWVRAAAELAMVRGSGDEDGDDGSIKDGDATADGLLLAESCKRVLMTWSVSKNLATVLTYPISDWFQWQSRFLNPLISIFPLMCCVCNYLQPQLH